VAGGLALSLAFDAAAGPSIVMALTVALLASLVLKALAPLR
jgi:ABC-type Mn2+/Zn2+ transport system permease subunit